MAVDKFGNTIDPLTGQPLATYMGGTPNFNPVPNMLTNTSPNPINTAFSNTSCNFFSCFFWF